MPNGTDLMEMIPSASEAAAYRRVIASRGEISIRAKEHAVRNMILAVSIAAVGVLLVSVPLIAHHGAAALDTGKEVTLKGTVTEWIWSNPHCFLQFDAKDDAGTVRNWAG